MYKTFKYSHGKEKYTEILPEHFKKPLLQFRIGSHKFTKLNNLRVKYMCSPGIRREPNVFSFVNIMQTNDPETIGNLAKFILHAVFLRISSLKKIDDITIYVA